MKVYSDGLTSEDLREALPNGVWLDKCEPIQGARVRSRGWNVRLTGSATNRHRNSGTHGAATWDSTPATYDEHGAWMAELFTRDHDARIACDDGFDAFHYRTRNRYRLPSEVTT